MEQQGVHGQIASRKCILSSKSEVRKRLGRL